METPTKKTSEFKKSFSSLDILMIAFGAGTAVGINALLLAGDGWSPPATGSVRQA